LAADKKTPTKIFITQSALSGDNTAEAAKILLGSRILQDRHQARNFAVHQITEGLRPATIRLCYVGAELG
jgi:hypothetical protein